MSSRNTGTRASLSNRGSNLMSAMNQMEDRGTLPPQAGDDTHLISGEPLPSASKFTPKTKLALGIFGVLAAAGIVTLIVLLASRTKPPVENIPCNFYVNYTNWVNYNLNGTGVTCPQNGAVLNCSSTADCLIISPLCVPGTRHALTCQRGGCSVLASTMPSMSHSGAVCDPSSDRPVCALCTSGACAGNALCVSAADCTSTKLGYSLSCTSSAGHSALNGDL